MLRLALLGLAVLALLPTTALGAAVPTSSTTSDAAGDQAPGDVWRQYPGQRAASDLRRAVFATSNGTLRMTFTFAASPTHARAYQTVAMSATLPDGRFLNISGWRHDGRVWTHASTGTGDQTRSYCAGRITVAVNRKLHQVTLRTPVSCLPSGRTLSSPYATSYLTVLRRNGVVHGHVASDSSFSGRTFRIR